MSKEIIAVSFGTSDAEARETCILPMEEAYARAFPNIPVRRAFTSRFIRAKLAREGIVIDSPEEAIAKVRAAGREPVIASTHLIPGLEYERLRDIAGDLPVSAPLLSDDADLARVASILADIRDRSGRALVLMGHGTDHAADDTYRRLRACLPENIFLACVEGEYTLDTVMLRLEALSDRRLLLMPLMLVAGDHARNDMSGPEPDSWTSRLTAAGFDPMPRLVGLGAIPAVQRMYIDKLSAVL